ncbi:hypothetical protein XENOCAPTIV_003776 [Xenoophorus captivus]|uniref:LIM interaction domain-containing protein n=1 Tax=Xenoophorus captivus TaxID=1517983 RepID=A0ABV0QGA8_9TELE
MGGEFGDEDERLITRLENTQYDATNGLDDEDDFNSSPALGNSAPWSTKPTAAQDSKPESTAPQPSQHWLCGNTAALLFVPDPSLTRFICAELTRGYFLEHNEAKYTERRERVYTCMRIPKELEKLMIFGFFLCADAFLYIFTLLPLRVLLALLRLLTLPCCGFR